MQFRTVPEMFLETITKYGDTSRNVYLRKIKNEYVGTTYSELQEMTESFSIGLEMLGLSKGDKVGIVSENRLEWIVSDFAITALGAIDVPVFPTLSAEQEEYVFTHSDCKFIIASNSYQLNKLLKFIDKYDHIEKIIVFNDDIKINNPKIIKYSEIIENGKKKYEKEEREKHFRENATKVNENDILTIIYTSGTTGDPKGVMLTHKNVISNVKGCIDAIDLQSERDVFLSFLPLCHAYERTAGNYTIFSCGILTAFAESIETVPTNLIEVKPTIMTSVPRLFERIKGRIYHTVAKDSPIKQKIFHWAVNVGIQHWRQEFNGNVSIFCKIQNAIADKLVLSKVRERLGGKLIVFISGGAAMPIEIGEFFHGIGIKIMEGYGLTETSPVLSVGRFDSLEIGTVGKPVLEVELKIADDGEILAKGPNVMLGYYKNEIATKEIIDQDGWFHTGDIGIITERGNLKITDRKKNIFISSGGKNIAPQNIENVISQSNFIDQMLIIGENREFCSALIVPDFDFIRNKYNYDKSITNQEITDKSELIKEIHSDINQLQKGLGKHEQVRKFHLIAEPFTVENDLMTPTLKLKRKKIESLYNNYITEMYESTHIE